MWGYDAFCLDFKWLLATFSFLLKLDVNFYRYIFFVSFSLSFLELFSFLQFPSLLLPSLIIQCFHRFQLFPVLTVVAFNLSGFHKTCTQHFFLDVNHLNHLQYFVFFTLPSFDSLLISLWRLVYFKIPFIFLLYIFSHSLSFFQSFFISFANSFIYSLLYSFIHRLSRFHIFFF